MTTRVVGAALAVVLASVFGTTGTTAQSSGSRVEAHVAAAKAAAGLTSPASSTESARSGPAATPAAPRPATPRPAGPPPRESWHAEPVKVFDNLYFLGQTEYSVWAVKTSEGIILIDAIFDYSVDDEVVGGLKELGLDPATIKYVVISHGHSDHSGGAKYLQDRFNAHVILTAADWDLLDKSNGTKPRRDMVATDGQKLTLGDTTLTLYITPGHTMGTLSTLIPVTDNGAPHVAASWGGTAFNWVANRTAYITPDVPTASGSRPTATRRGGSRRSGQGRRRHHLEPHDFDGSNQAADARAAQARRAASARHRQRWRPALPDRCRRMRAGRPRARAISAEPYPRPRPRPSRSDPHRHRDGHRLRRVPGARRCAAPVRRQRRTRAAHRRAPGTRRSR